MTHLCKDTFFAVPVGSVTCYNIMNRVIAELLAFYLSIAPAFVVAGLGPATHFIML